MNGVLSYAEVQYYFELNLPNHPALAMVSVYSDPLPDLLRRSYSTVWSCTHGGAASLRVIDVKAIQAVVAMIPHPAFPAHPELSGRFFLVEKMGLGAGGSMDDIDTVDADAFEDDE